MLTWPSDHSVDKSYVHESMGHCFRLLECSVKTELVRNKPEKYLCHGCGVSAREFFYIFHQPNVETKTVDYTSHDYKRGSSSDQE